MGVLSLLLGPITEILKQVLPDEKARREAEAKLLQLQEEGKLREAEVQLSAIIAEAKSKDPWTSRARPTFLYVVYAYLLAAVPFGVLFYFDPPAADAVVTGAKAWLDAIPDEMWTLFGIGYLGYTGARSWDKAQIARLKKRER